MIKKKTNPFHGFVDFNYTNRLRVTPKNDAYLDDGTLAGLTVDKKMIAFATVFVNMKSDDYRGKSKIYLTMPSSISFFSSVVYSLVTSCE